MLKLTAYFNLNRKLELTISTIPHEISNVLFTRMKHTFSLPPFLPFFSYSFPAFLFSLIKRKQKSVGSQSQCTTFYM